MDNMGISFYRKEGRLRAAYGIKHGFGCGWLPQIIQFLFIKAFNFIGCRFSGHDDTLFHLKATLPEDEPIVCLDCGAKLKRCQCR